MARAVGPHSTVIIDEVQRVPDLLSAVHLLIEEEPRRQFVLTGSSARKLKRASVDLLSGRAIRKELFPFLAGELGGDFDLGTALSIGTVPLIFTASEPRSALQSYVELYVREEVQAEALTRNVNSFYRFLAAITFSHGGVLNISSVAREADVDRKVAENHVAILEDLLLAYRLNAFRKRAQRRLTAHPKFYFIDPGSSRCSGRMGRSTIPAP